MRMPCPDTTVLQDQLQSPSYGDRDERIEEHLLECSACRDHFRELRLVDSILLAPAGSLPDDFEEQFAEGVLDRMVTTEERMGFLQIKSKTRSLVVLCVVTILISMVAYGNLTGGGSQPVRVAKPAVELSSFDDADVLRRRALARLDNDLLLAAGDGDISSFSDDLVDSFQVRYKRLDATLGAACVRLLESSQVQSVREHLLSGLGHGDAIALGYLQRESHRRNLPLLERERLVSVAVRMGTHASFRFIERQLQCGVDMDLVLRQMDEAPRAVQARFLDRVLRKQFHCSSGLLAARLQGLPGSLPSHLLWRVIRSDPQSAAVGEAILARPEMAGFLRKQAFDDSASSSERQLAIQFLGLRKDADSVRSLCALMNNRKLALFAVAALGQIGSPEAMTALAERLVISRRGEVRETRFNAALKRALHQLGSAAADFFLHTVERGASSHPRLFVVAAGIAGNARHLPALGEFLKRDDLKTAVVHALGLMGGMPAEEVLRGLLRQDDRRIVREARHTLRRRRGTAPSGPRLIAMSSSINKTLPLRARPPTKPPATPGTLPDAST